MRSAAFSAVFFLTSGAYVSSAQAAEPTAFAQLASKAAALGIKAGSLSSFSIPSIPRASGKDHKAVAHIELAGAYSHAAPGQFGAVVGLVMAFPGGKAGLCSGTLISPSVILTAAHCLEGVRDPSSILVFTGDIARENLATRAVAAVQHPGYVPSQHVQTNLVDLGVVAVRPGSIKARPYSVSKAAPSRGDSVTLVGYGITPGGNRAIMGNEKNYGSSTVAGLYNSKYLVVDGQTGACEGDSGSPALVGNQVVGVVSGGPQCAPNVPDLYNRVDASYDWIQSMVLKYSN